jgi:hypothetical protein
MPFVGIGVGIGRQRFASGDIPFVGILDLYPNATVAYSLRKLRDAYTGDAIRVRRSSDNTELNIGFVNNELDTSALTTFCGAGNGFVTTWYDQSGNANDLTQANATNQALIVSSGSVKLRNSKPTMTTDGNDFYETIMGIYASTTNFSSYQVVTELSNNTNNDFIFGVTNSAYGNADNNIVLRKSSSIFEAIVNNGILDARASLARDTNQNILSIIYRGGVDLTFWKNSTSNVNSVVAASVNPTRELEVASGLNATLGAELDFQEKIDWKTDQTANASAIRTNIANYYNITL